MTHVGLSPASTHTPPDRAPRVTTSSHARACVAVDEAVSASVHPRMLPPRRATVRLLFASLGVLAAAAHASSASAQQAPATPGWCVPGTALCAQAAGQGSGAGRAGVSVGGSAAGQVGPGGVQGSGQVQGRGSANAGGQAQGSGQATRPAPAPAPAPAPPPAPDPPRRTTTTTRTPDAPPTYASNDVPDAPPARWVPTGPPLALGMAPCLMARVGVWSGVHAGACFGFGLRSYDGVGFELDLVVLGGGTVPTLDILLRPTLVIPLAGRTPYFDQLSMKIGSTIVGGSIPVEAGHGSGYVRFGGSVGLGYDVALGDSVDWRVLDASFYAEVAVGGSKAAYMDRLGDRWDLGLMLTSGVFFH